MTKIGAHVSVAGGLERAFENAKKIGAECIQIFGSSPRQWSAKQKNEKEIKEFEKAGEKSDIRLIYLHAAYLVNLASPDSETRKKSIKSLTDHLLIANSLNARGLIFHLGSGKGMERERALELTCKGIKQVLKTVPGNSLLIMENSSGGGGKVGHGLDEIALIFTDVNSARVKICLDTAHAFESGTLDFSKSGIIKFIREFDKKIGLANLEVIHANDSKTDLGSMSDRHENIGKGKIGREGLCLLAKQKKLANIPWILEVPGFDGNGPDKKNINILKDCFK